MVAPSRKVFRRRKFFTELYGKGNQMLTEGQEQAIRSLWHDVQAGRADICKAAGLRWPQVWQAAKELNLGERLLEIDDPESPSQDDIRREMGQIRAGEVEPVRRAYLAMGNRGSRVARRASPCR